MTEEGLRTISAPSAGAGGRLTGAQATQRCQCLSNFVSLSLDQIEQLLRGANVLFALGVGVDGLEVVALGLDLVARDGPAVLALTALGQKSEKLLEVGGGKRCLLTDLDVREVVVPDALGGPAFGEEEQIGLDAGAGCREHAA